jgi:hypothetical protein
LALRGVAFPVRKPISSATINEYGDSITVNVGASIPANAYAALIGTAENAAVNNQAISGSQITTQIDRVYATTIAQNAQSLILTGYNDMRNYGTNTGQQQMYTDALKASLAWLAVPESAKIRACAWNGSVCVSAGAGVTYTGTWVHSIAYAGLGANTAGTGTATVSVTGSTIYLGYIKLPTIAGSFTVAVDGGSPVTVNGNLGQTDGNGRAYGGALYRVSGLNNVAHTVVISWVSGTVYFDWIAGLPGPYSTVGKNPALYVGNCLRMTTAGYAAGGSGSYIAGSDAAVIQFNAIILAAVQLLQGDGLTVTLVDAMSAYNPTTDVAVDNIHPADAGHAKIANAFLLAMP